MAQNDNNSVNVGFQYFFSISLCTCVETGVLLDVRQLLESPITIRTFVRLLTRVNSEMHRAVRRIFSQIFSKISIITWCAAPTGGCWRRTWDIADTDEASPRVCLRYLLCQAALPSLSSNTKQNKISHEKNNPTMQKCVLFSMDGQDSCSLLFDDPLREKSGFIKYHQSTEKPGALSTLWHAAPVWHLSSGHHTIIAGPLHSKTQHCSSHQALSLSLSLRIYLSEVSSLHVACSADWPGLHRGQCTQCLEPEHEVSGADCRLCFIVKL